MYKHIMLVSATLKVMSFCQSNLGQIYAPYSFNSPHDGEKETAKQNKSRHDRCAFLVMCSFHESKAEKGDLRLVQTSSKGGLQTRSQSSIEFSAKRFRKLRCLNVQQLL